MSIFGSETTASVWRRFVYALLRKKQKGVTILDPVGGDSITLWVPRHDITITDVSAHRQGGTNVTFNIEHGTNPSNPGTSLWSSNQVVTANTALDQSFDAYNDATIPADSLLKLEITAVTGSVSEFHVTIEYTID